MTDERINLKLEDLTRDFNDTYYINVITRAFNAGCEITERLAKIEVLEKIKLTAWSAVDTDEVLEEVRIMISELKAGN